MVEAIGMVDLEDLLHAVVPVEVVEPEIATKVSAHIATLTAILQMHAESGNVLRREETTMSTFVSLAGSQESSKLIASPRNVSRTGGK